jgi:hypothetical protein
MPNKKQTEKSKPKVLRYEIPIHYFGPCGQTLKVYVCDAKNCAEAVPLINRAFGGSYELEDEDDKEKFETSIATFTKWTTRELTIIFCKDYLTIKTIAHEVMHFVRCILELTWDAPLNESTEEIYAVLLGEMVEAICKALYNDGVKFL